MRWRSWAGLLVFCFLAALALLVGWVVEEGSFARWWVPTVACSLGLVLLLGTWLASVREHGSRTRPSAFWLLLYACSLCACNPVMAIARWPQYAPLFVLALAPLAWAGVTGLGRGWWVRATGAWLVLFGQFFAVIYNKSFSGSVTGFWSAYVY